MEDNKEAVFWENIREDLIDYAKGECGPAWLPMVESRVKAMGPSQLMELYNTLMASIK